MPKKQDARDRAARVAAMRAAQQRKERRRTIVIIGVALVTVLAIAAAVTVAIVREQNQKERLEAAAKAPISGVQEFKNLGRKHVQTPVTYPQNPPAGGDHTPVWTNCGVYTNQLANEPAVHSMEHGAVWITYRPGLAKDQLDRLTRLAEARDYVLLSPYEGLPSPVVASAWGLQLKLENASDPRLERFLVKYVQGPQTPEPGSACTGGLDGAGQTP
ncbi:MAG: DUF3105 domain-containing protein [Angustibacter sp.]